MRDQTAKERIEMLTIDPEVVFLFPKVFKEIYYEGCDYHLGAGYIRAFLGKHGVASHQYVDSGDRTIDDVARRVLAMRPSIVGFSCYDGNYFYVKLLAEKLRRMSSGIAIVCGGPTASFSDDLILGDCSAVDVVVRSYGEETTLDLVRWKRGARDLRDIAGISYRENGSVIRMPNRAQKADAPSVVQVATRSAFGDSRQNREPPISLDAFPDPYVEGYIPADRVADIGIVTSRGCAFACTFCNFAAMSDRKVYYQSIEKVLEIFRFFERQFEGCGERKLVTINDDNFSMHKVRFHDLLRSIAAERFKNLAFWAEMRVEPLEQASFPLLAAAGFQEINFGLESGDPRVLAISKKVRPAGAANDGYAKEKSYIDKIEFSVNQLREHGIKTCVSVIFGLPGETLEEGERTLEIVRRLNLTRYAHNYITVRLGTELARTYREHGIETETVPGRALPLTTRPSYDVHAIEVLAHDESQLPIRGILLQDSVVLFSGMGHFAGRNRRVRESGRGGQGLVTRDEKTQIHGPVPLLMVERFPADRDATVRWLADSKPLASMIWMDERAGDYASVELSLASGGVPTLEALWLRRTEPSSMEPRTSIGGMALAATRSVVSLIDRSVNDLALQRARTVGSDAEADCVSLVAVQDIGKFSSAFATGESGLCWRVPRAAIARRLFVRDGCRWSSSECPAPAGLRWFVNDGAIRACPPGASLGTVGLDVALSGLQESASARAEETRRARSCATCSAKEHCSKCVDTAPFDADTFCRIKRGKHDISHLLDGLALGHSLLDAEEGRLPPDPSFAILSLKGAGGVVETPTGCFPLASCILFCSESSDYSYLHSARHQHLARLSQAQHEIICALLP